MTSEIIENLEFQEYNSLNKITYGVLRAVKKCPAKASLMLDGMQELHSGHARLGNAIHCAVLEPHKFLDYQPSTCREMQYNGAICGNKAYIRSEGLWYCFRHGQNYEPDSDQPYTCDKNEIEICNKVKEAFDNHSGVKTLLSSEMKNEVSLVWTDEKTSLECKCRPDILSIENGIVLDLKTTSKSVHPMVFQKYAVQEGYIHQAGFTKLACENLGINLNNYYIVAVETNPPYCVAVYQLDEDDIDWAKQELLEGLNILDSCMKSGDWFGYEGVLKLKIPESFRKESPYT